MAGETRRNIKEGVAFGVIAGIVFALIETAASAAMGNSVLVPWQMFASVVMGASALDAATAGTLALGVFVHLVLSAIFGAIYGMFNAQASRRTQTGWGSQVGTGLLFGLAVWLVNFQIIARIAYPWFLETPQVLQLAIHALFFGLPLALMMTGAERRVYHRERAPTHA